ncbi:hypothetical protein HUN39_01765 [Methylocystis sp. FS]|uniref:hypothetical protein n=1 Tax=Methylocystis silviterrae TaxID=2743612 RepID=UPI00158183AB|nr:hypothetical protein [Methylocystis silviterrae]NUJ78777.1 hypothetical protein [Methylocystis silviterrae]
MKKVRLDALGRAAAAALAGAALFPEPTQAQQQPPRRPHPPHGAGEAAGPAAPPTERRATLRLSATLAANDQQPVRSGLVWRVFEESAQPDGSHKLVAQSEEAVPTLPLPDGSYIVHAAYGLAGVTRRVAIEGGNVSERIVLNAGGLKLIDKLGDAEIPAQRLSISIYVPERGNSEAKLILANANADQVICLPEGAYHIVSTLLDTGQGAQGGTNQTNSVVTADLKIPAGKLIEATLRHRAATMTLKLVKQPGGEALANTSFSVLTPGGDVIREMIGAFPSLVLAEGEYVAIARHEGKTYQGAFRVQSTKDSDVEILIRDQPRNHANDEHPQ